MLDRNKVTEIIRHQIAAITSRFTFDQIKPSSLLKEVDINSESRLGRLKTRIIASVKSTNAGKLNVSRFKAYLDFKTTSKVKDAATAVLDGLAAAWSEKE